MVNARNRYIFIVRPLFFLHRLPLLCRHISQQPRKLLKYLKQSTYSSLLYSFAPATFHSPIDLIAPASLNRYADVQFLVIFCLAFIVCFFFCYVLRAVAMAIRIPFRWYTISATLYVCHSQSPFGVTILCLPVDLLLCTIKPESLMD